MARCDQWAVVCRNIQDTLYEVMDALSTVALRPGQMLVSFIAVAVVGFGLLFLRKWAAIYLSFPSFLLGFGSFGLQ